MNAKKLIKATFPARLDLTGHCPIEFNQEGQSGGLTAWRPDGTLDHVLLPPELSASARTVRMHEADHIRFSPRSERETVLIYGDGATQLSFNAINFLEDARISTSAVWGTRPERVKRDACAMAIGDLRITLKSLRATSKPGMRTSDYCNFSLGVILRSTALLGSCASKSHGARIMRVLGALYQTGAYPARKAREALEILIWNLHAFHTNIGARPRTGWRETPHMVQLRRMSADIVEAWRKLQFPPDPEPDLTPADRPIVPYISESTDIDTGQCKITRLPLVIDTLAYQRNIVRYPAMTGPRYRAGSLVQIALGIPGLHFIRRTVKSSVNGAAVMIDASGSMHLKHEDLESLSAQIPAGFIAYYCAKDEECGGEITIFADNGRRAAGIPRRCGSGNFVDYQAVCMLMRRSEEPRILVSDLGFCGGSGSQTMQALQIVANAQRTGALVVVPTIQAAIDYLAVNPTAK